MQLHVDHVVDSRRVPGRDVLVERSRLIEQIVHVHHPSNVPSADVSVERRLVIEQTVHVGDGGDVPVADVAVCLRSGRGARRPGPHGRLDVAVGDGRALGDGGGR